MARRWIRKLLKTAAIALAGLVVTAGGFFGLLMFPGWLFSYDVEYKNFVVRSDSALEVQDVKGVLDEVDAALGTSELNDPTLIHQVLLGHDNRAFEVLQNVAWWMTSRAVPDIRRTLTYSRAVPPYTSQIITFRIPNFENGTLIHPESGFVAGMAQIVAHEATHTLITARVGSEVMTIPGWKQEGYANYVAASKRILEAPGYSLADSVDRILAQDLSWMMDSNGDFLPFRYGCLSEPGIADEAGNVGPACYYVSRVLVEYLLNVKGLTFDELISPDITYVAVLEDLFSAYRAADL